MRADQILSERPAPVAPLPPRRVPKSVPFSTARSVIFSMAIDTPARASSTWCFKRRHSRVSCSPTSRATARTGISRASATTSASNHSVKPLPRLAHGTSASFTPHSVHLTRGTRACRYARCWKKSRCRQRFRLESCALQPPPPHDAHANVPPASKSTYRSSRRSAASNSVRSTRHGRSKPRARSNSDLSVIPAAPARPLRIPLTPQPVPEIPGTSKTCSGTGGRPRQPGHPTTPHPPRTAKSRVFCCWPCSPAAGRTRRRRPHCLRRRVRVPPGSPSSRIGSSSWRVTRSV